MHADTKLDAAIFRYAGVAPDHASLNFDRASDGVDHTAKLDDEPVAIPFDDAAVADGDCWVDEVAAQSPQPREDSLLVRSREPAVADNIGNQNCSDLPRFH